MPADISVGAKRGSVSDMVLKKTKNHKLITCAIKINISQLTKFKNRTHPALEPPLTCKRQDKLLKLEDKSLI
jgi:hypothetical protein